MIRIFLRSAAAHFRAGRTLFLLTVLGVALGVASVLSIQILNLNALGAFQGSLKAVSGEADLSLLPRGPSLPESLFPGILAQEGIRAAWPLVRADVAVTGRPSLFLELVGLDLFAPLRLPWKKPPAEISAALGEPGWVALTPALAAENGWKVGDRFEVSLGTRRATLRVGALVDFQKLTPLASRRLAVMDIAQAQGLLGLRGRLDQVDLVLAPGEDPAAVARRMEERLGPAVKAVTPEQRGRQAAGLMGAFRLNLTALSLISLFVGAFLVYSSTQASLVRRRSEFGLMRSLGATRGQVLGIILGEVTLLGLLGVAAGIPLGYAAARSGLKTVSATLSNLYLLEEIETLTLPPSLFLLAAAIGVGGALAGALFPALDISRRDTRTLLAPFTLHERVGAAAVRLSAAGGLVLGSTLAWYAAFGRNLKPGGFVVGIGILVALPLICPLAVQQAASRLPVRSFSLFYGLRSLAQRLGITSVAVGALAVAVSMLVGITLMIGSFRRTLEVWIDSTLHADVYVTSASWRRARGDAVLDPRLVEALASRPEVARADRLRQVWSDSGAWRVPVIGVDMGLPGGQSRFELLEGDPREAIRRVREEGAVLVGEPLARKEGLRVGGHLKLAGPSGEISLPVAGIYYDYGSERGSVAMDLAGLARRFGPGPVTNLALYLRPGTGAEKEADLLRAAFAGEPLEIRSNRRLRTEIFRIFDQAFAVTRLLQGMCLLIAVCGITLTLLVIARERISELALYRALGARREQVFRIFLGKGLGMAAFGIVLGTLGGVALALILVFLINRSYFGWTIALAWPAGAVAEEAALLLLAAAAATCYPAFRASRTPAAELSRDDL